MATLHITVYTTPELSFAQSNRKFVDSRSDVNTVISHEMKKEITASVEDICRKHLVQFSVDVA